MLVNKPFRDWKNAIERFTSHGNAEYHTQSMILGEHFTSNIEHPENSIDVQFKPIKAENIRNNRIILASIINAILYCGRQCIGLRGDHENLNTSGNPGNFLALLNLIGQYDQTVKGHLD